MSNFWGAVHPSGIRAAFVSGGYDVVTVLVSFSRQNGMHGGPVWKGRLKR